MGNPHLRVGAGFPSHLVDPDVLEATAVKLHEVTGRRLIGPWEVVQIDQRRKSTVVRLRAMDEAGHDTVVFYKVPTYNDNDRTFPISETAYRDALERLIPFTDIFNRLSAGSGVSAAPIVAVDQATMATVTLAVPGRQLTSYLGEFHPRRLLHLGRIHFLLGGACKKIDESNLQWAEEPEPMVDAAVEFSVSRFGDPLDQIPRGRARLQELAEEANSEPGATIFGHGDLFGSNVLVDGPCIGLIDFTLGPQIKMHDLAYIAFRTSGHTRLTVGNRRRLIGKLLAGYGSESLAEDPSWRLARALMVLRHLGRSRSRSRAALAGTTGQLTMLLEARDPWL